MIERRGEGGTVGWWLEGGKGVHRPAFQLTYPKIALLSLIFLLFLSHKLVYIYTYPKLQGSGTWRLTVYPWGMSSKFSFSILVTRPWALKRWGSSSNYLPIRHPTKNYPSHTLPPLWSDTPIPSPLKCFNIWKKKYTFEDFILFILYYFFCCFFFFFFFTKFTPSETFFITFFLGTRLVEREKEKEEKKLNWTSWDG